MAGDIDRDREMDGLLKRTLRGGDASPGPCLEPEQFAAWADGNLSADDARAVELHLSTCARCQAIAAAFATSGAEPRPEPAEEPARVSADVVPITAKRPIRWALPIAAGTIAATLLVWFGTRSTQPQPVAEIAAKLDATPPAARADAAPQQQAQLAESRDARQEKQLQSPPLNRVSPTEMQKSVRRDAAQPPPPAAAPPPPQPTFRSTIDPQAAATKPPPPAARPVGEVRPSTNLAFDAVMAESVVVEGKAITEFSSPLPLVAQESVGLASARTAAGAGGGGGGRGGGAAGGRGGGAAGATAVGGVAGGAVGGVAKVEPAADAPTTSWRIFDRNVVQRSRDAGRSWQQTPIEPALPGITTGVAPSKTVCWLIGRAGLVLVTSDALTFRRAATPANVDLLFVQATDALSATVTAADGRKFTTADGGLTWK